MGWLYSEGQTRRQLIAHLTKDWTSGETGKTFRCLKHTARGNVLWTVWEITKPDGTTDRFIGCALMQTLKGYGWGYKAMEESMGPCYYSCPLSYLDMVPCPDHEYAVEWREKVRHYHAKQRRKFEVGQVVKLVGSTIPQVTITSARPLLGTYAGKTYRIPRKMVA